MKKQTKVIIAIVLAIVVIIFAISIIYPPAFKGLTSGTIGKADKYHKSQMTEKDIQLRSEVTSDTSQLKSMIQGLIYFSLFTMDLSNKIDSCVTAFKTHGICSQQNGCANILVLEDYSDFIKNNSKTLGTTISMLTGFYLKDKSDQSADVEKNLREFGNYVNNLNEKDSILEDALHSMDNFMITSKAIKARKTELAQLKSIRDQLLVKGIQLSGMLQDKPLCSNLLSYALSSQEGQLGQMCAQELSGSVIKSNQSLNIDLMQEAVQSLNSVSSNLTVGSAQQLGSVLQSHQLGSSSLKKNEIGSQALGVLLYDKANLSFVVSNVGALKGSLSAAQLSVLMISSRDMGAVAFYSSQGLNLVASSYDLKSAYQSQMIGSALSAAQLGYFINAQQGIGSFSFGSNFVGMTQQLGNMGLGSTTDR
jgi:hypothetical protein